MKTLYLDCHSGISSDMAAAALLDLGANESGLREALDSLFPGAEIAVGRTERNGISACTFSVRGREEEPDHAHHPLSEILEKIQQSALSEKAKASAVEIYRTLGCAEAEVHGMKPENVILHEAGSVPSVLAVLAVAYCLDNLGIERITASPLSDGNGTVSCSHGVIPVPVPAVAAICRAHSIPLNITDIPTELVTPTGAAIVSLASFTPPQNAVITAVGYGAGTKIVPNFNLLRALLFEETDFRQPSGCRDRILVLETNLDDCTAEELGFCMEELFRIGARDVWFTPIFMKKNRPAYSLGVMCRPDAEQAAADTIFRCTSAIGLRRTEEDRIIMDRKPVQAETPYGPVAAKLCTYGSITKLSVEYESAKDLAEKNHIEIGDICRSVFFPGGEQNK